MGFIYKRRIKTSKNTRLNVSTGGVSGTAKLGKRISVNSRGGIRIKLAKGLTWKIGK